MGRLHMMTRVEAILAGKNVREMRHVILLDDDGAKYEHEFFTDMDSDVEPIIRLGVHLWKAGQVSGPAMFVVWYDKEAS